MTMPVMEPLHISMPLRLQRHAAMWFGRRAPKRVVERARTALGLVELGAWMAETGNDPREFETDFDLFDFMARRTNGSEILYLEFGVYEGRSMAWWSDRLWRSHAHLVGFDSFQGLPEDWTGVYGKGAFVTEGPPEILDPKVSWEMGWFEDTLANYVPPRHDQLIINIDCDLYSATRTVLSAVHGWLKPGTLIYFDEFAHPDHEQKALREFIASTGIRVFPLAYAGAGAHWVFQVVTVP